MHDITRRSALKLTMAATLALGGIATAGSTRHAMADETGQINVSDHQHPSFGSISAYIYPSFNDEKYGNGTNGQTYDAFYLGDDFFAVTTHYETNGTANIASEGELEDAVNAYILNDTFVLNTPIEQGGSYGFQRIEDIGDDGDPFVAYQAGPYTSPAVTAYGDTIYLMCYAFCGQDGGLLVVTESSPWDPESLPNPKTYCVTGSVDCVTGEPSALQRGTINEAGFESQSEETLYTQRIETEEGSYSYSYQWDTECTFLTVDGGQRTVKHLFLETIGHAPTASDIGRYVQGFLISSGNHRIHWAGYVMAANRIYISAFWYWPGTVKYPVVATSYDIDGFHWFGFDPIEGDFRIS